MKHLNFACRCMTGALALGLLAACNGNGRKTSLDNLPVVAERVQTSTGEVITCDLSLMKDTVDMPLSAFSEELQWVQLENSDTALVGGWIRTVIGEKYILVSNNKQNPFKLFTRDGKFVCNIGAYGQGPGEYLNTYDQQLDEANNRIYILPWNSSKILAYDLTGKFVGDIPLSLRVPKGKFRVDTPDSTVTITTLPFSGYPAVVWQQDMHGGKPKQYVKPGHLTVPRDFSNEINNARNTDAYDVMLFVIGKPREDSLYHYNMAENRLEPRFTVKFTGDELPWHGYVELPGYFFGDISYPVQVSENSFIGSKPVFYIVDKQTLKGSYVRFNDNGLGMTYYPAFGDGYYVSSMEPGQLLDNMDKVLEKNNASPETKQRIEKIKSSIDPEGNNVVLFARLKR